MKRKLLSLILVNSDAKDRSEELINLLKWEFSL